MPAAVNNVSRSTLCNKSVLVTVLALALGGGIVGCKKSPPRDSRLERQAEDLQNVKFPGYNLHDNLALSASLVRVALAGTDSSTGVLVSENKVLAPDMGCGDSPARLIFSSQGNDPVTNAASIRSESRSVSGCQSVKSILAEKIKAAGSNPPALLTALAATLQRLDTFDIAVLSFEGGTPSIGSLKPKAIASHDETLTISSGNPEWRAWEALTGKFIAFAGFNREEATPKGKFSRRVWLPLRIPAEQSSTEDPFTFQAETWIVDSSRSPIRYPEEWIKGPSNFFLPSMLFTGVARFPNVTPDAEIQTPDPRLLAFVYGWQEIKEAPGAQRFAPRCLDAAPILALLQ